MATLLAVSPKATVTAAFRGLAEPVRRRSNMLVTKIARLVAAANSKIAMSRVAEARGASGRGSADRRGWLEFAHVPVIPRNGLRPQTF